MQATGRPYQSFVFLFEELSRQQGQILIALPLGQAF
jgi:hypothetical protein